MVKGEKFQKSCISVLKSCISVLMVANHSESIIFPECKAGTRRMPTQTEKAANMKHKKNKNKSRIQRLDALGMKGFVYFLSYIRHFSTWILLPFDSL